jgi:5-methylcytosine-specific restriction endonuclease McrA
MAFRITKTCVVCKKEYQAKSKNQKYCGWDCRLKGDPDSYARERYIIFQRDEFRCAYCGATAYGDGVRLHTDHIVPKVSGGKDIAGNLITSCKDCNLSKNAGQLPDSIKLIILEEVRRRNKVAMLSDYLSIRL